MQASSPTTDVNGVRELMTHPAFTLRNPNRARSLVSTFCAANPVAFHAPDGSGYAFWAESVTALDALNPQVASRLARAMDRWRRYTPALQALMKEALQQVAGQGKLSNDVREVVSKALAN
jgi:aminopeptidase N